MALKFLSDPYKKLQADWLPFERNEIMYVTDGVKTTGYISGCMGKFFSFTQE